MALKYELLSEDQRIKLWDLFFQMYEDNDPNIRFEFDARELVKAQRVIDMRLNGREIRNGS